MHHIEPHHDSDEILADNVWQSSIVVNTFDSLCFGRHLGRCYFKIGLTSAISLYLYMNFRAQSFIFRFFSAISMVVLLGAMLFSPQLASAEVWQATEVWSDQWEIKYAEWIANSFNERFFIENEWAGIETDCADAVYAARVIFSFQNKLPFALSGSRERQLKFSNTTNDFDSVLDPTERVKAFLDRINDRTWTGSLAVHTYPIEVSNRTVIPGTIWLKPGHVEIVKRVRQSGVVELQGSWLPASVRKMITITTLGVFPQDEATGFRRWVWPQNIGKPMIEQPGYVKPEKTSPRDEQGESLSAFELNQRVSLFEESVRSRLASPFVYESKLARIQRLADDFCRMSHARQEVVQLGHRHITKRLGLEKAEGACLVPKEYHLYSTPSRDSNLRRVVIALSLELDNRLYIVNTALAGCPPIEGDGYSISAEDFLLKLIRLDFSSNPHESMSTRFGLSPVEGRCELEY